MDHTASALLQDEMIIALGVTLEAKKVLLGFTQAAIEEGFLCVMDGSKGIRKENGCLNRGR